VGVGGEDAHEPDVDDEQIEQVSAAMADLPARLLGETAR
jgi:hypothetical protein